MNVNVISRAIAIGLFLAGLVCLYPLAWLFVQITYVASRATPLELLQVALLTHVSVDLLFISLWLWLHAVNLEFK